MVSGADSAGASPARAVPVSASHAMAPRLGPVSWARASRTRLSGMRRASRVASGIAFVMSTLTMDSSCVVSRRRTAVSATLSHTMATRAPWSSNCARSSAAV